jgi:hypothetical protein
LFLFIRPPLSGAGRPRGSGAGPRPPARIGQGAGVRSRTAIVVARAMR